MSSSHIVAVTMIFLFGLSLIGCACSPAMDQRVKESVDLGLDDYSKATDITMASVMLDNVSTDLVLRWYRLEGYIGGSVSHGVGTLTGKLPTQELIDTAVELAKKTKRMKEVNSEIELDPSLPECPFDI